MKLTYVLVAPLASLTAAASWYGVRDVARIASDRISGPVFDAVNNLRGEVYGLPGSAAQQNCIGSFEATVVRLNEARSAFNAIVSQAQQVISSQGGRLAQPEGKTHSLEPMCPAYEGL
ncbi:hypothetical protein QBC34DRAFT_428458 [Podospora aff. communis PSN243]|uniref:Uncharacterized protein n=1 Tax=Podospora aff. communis PSN243 TaxID=3040156 RepID=A0AAV9GEY3_9PEZI|nr:hypothetical protein QBC34DRAFT_428458 [Podospora aff. communis PSN243]